MKSEGSVFLRQIFNSGVGVRVVIKRTQLRTDLLLSFDDLLKINLSKSRPDAEEAGLLQNVGSK